MTAEQFDERQKLIRGRISTISLIFALSLIVALTMLLELTGDWMTLHALGLTVVWLTLGLHTVLAIIWDAYMPPATRTVSMKWLYGFLVCLLLLQAVNIGRQLWTGHFLEDGRLGTAWTSTMLFVALGSALVAGAWKYVRSEK